MWHYKNKVIKSIDDLPEGFGFVYKITNLTKGIIYIGRKNFYSKRKRNFGKKEKALLKDKRARTWEFVIKESDWLGYTGSSKPLNEAIKEGDKIDKEIIVICQSKAELTYFETKYQFCEGVIEEEDKSYNSNILGRFYSKIFKKDE